MNPFIQIAAAFFGSLGFAMLFNLRGPWLFFTALGGCLSWCIYLLIGCFINHYEWQYFAAAFFLGIYSEIMARKTKSPSTLYLAVGMIPLIPGAALYYTMQNAVLKNFQICADRGRHCIRYYHRNGLLECDQISFNKKIKLLGGISLCMSAV